MLRAVQIQPWSTRALGTQKRDWQRREREEEGGALAPQSWAVGDSETLCKEQAEGAAPLAAVSLGDPSLQPSPGVLPDPRGADEAQQGPNVFRCVPGCCGPSALLSICQKWVAIKC